MGKYSLIDKPWWNDRPCLLIGGGPSLKGYDIRDLREHGRVVAINDSVRYIESDVLFSADANFVRRSYELIQNYEGEEVVLAVTDVVKPVPLPHKTPITCVERACGIGWSASRAYLYMRGNSGYSALNLAFVKKAKRIYLLGYDMSLGTHQQWHSSERELGLPKRIKNPNYYKGWADNFKLVLSHTPPGTEVVNLNSESAVSFFKKGCYEDLGIKLSGNI